MQSEPLSRGMRSRPLRIWSARVDMLIPPRGGKAWYKWSKAVKRYASAVRMTSSREQCWSDDGRRVYVSGGCQASKSSLAFIASDTVDISS